MFFSRLCVARAFSRNKYALGHHSSAQKREWPWTVITFLNGVKGRYNSKKGRQNCSNPPEKETEYRQTAQRNGGSETLRSLSARRVTFIADGQDIYTFNATDSEGKTVLKTSSVSLGIGKAYKESKMVAVAAGEKKAEAIIAATRHEKHDSLITDEAAAQKIVALLK